MDDCKPRPLLRSALAALALTFGLFGVAGIAPARADEPYKWPVIPPPAKAPHPNAFDIYNEAYKMSNPKTIAGKGWISPGDSGAPAYTKHQLAVAAAENLRVVAKVREGFRYGYVGPPHRSFTELMPYYAHFRQLARIMVFESQQSAAHHRWDEAVGYDVDAMRLGSDFWKDEGLIAALVGMACDAIGNRHAWDIIGHLSGSTAKLEARRVQAIDDRFPSAAAMIKSEERSCQAALEEILRKSNWRDQIMNPGGSKARLSALDSIMLQEQLDALTPDEIMRDYTSSMDARVRKVELPYSEFLTAPSPPIGNDVVAEVLVPVVDRARSVRECCYAVNELLSASLALQAYKAARGRYPSSLAVLVPVYLSRMPIDPFADGKPPAFRLTTSGYILYSVGPDGKDDGGKPIYDATRKPSLRYRVNTKVIQSGDIVAGVNH